MNIGKKAICISFYKEMDDICQQVLTEMGIQLETMMLTYSDIDVFDDRLQSKINEGLEIVVCRGVLADYIRRKFDIKVLEILISSYDALKYLYQYADTNTKLACVECSEFCNKIREVSDVLGLDMTCYSVNDIVNFQIHYDVAISDGAEVVVGGAWGILFPEKQLVQYISVEYTARAVRSSLYDALEYFEMICHEKEHSDFLNTILNYSKEGIIAIDNKAIIKSINMSAATMLHRQIENAIGQDIIEILPEFKEVFLKKWNIAEKNKIVDICGENYIFSRIPLFLENEITGSVYFISKTKSLLETERNIRLANRKNGLVAKHYFTDMVAKSRASKETISRAVQYSHIESTVLLLGETGAGKEYFAQSIHNESPRASEPFVAINCAALSSNLLESEMFGYESGAFTGASKKGKAGIFEIAHGGTIFLDEIGDIDLKIQTSLLRVLQEREVRRIGGEKIIPVDVRVIAATNKDLHEAVDEGKFRMDLYYRLNVLTINIPPLRKRREDILPLAEYIIREKNLRLNCKVNGMDSQTKEKLINYEWPGNIRELNNIIEKMVVLTQSGYIDFERIADAVPEFCNKSKAMIDEPDNISLEEIERRAVIGRLKICSNNKAKAARSLGIGQATLFRKIKKYKLSD